jgi:hypothetical protein
VVEKMVATAFTLMVSDGQVSSDIGDEVAIIDFRTGMYYGLDSVGARVWALIQEPRTVSEIRDILTSEYEVDTLRCERDLVALHQRLVEEGLVEIESVTSAYVFVPISGGEQRLLLKAALLLRTVRLGLWLLPFETFRRLLVGFSKEPARLRDTDQSSLENVIWAVQTAGRCIPGAATCLTLALISQVLLLLRGHGAVIHIGIAKGDEEQFLAHAWVESDGKIVIGGHEI